MCTTHDRIGEVAQYFRENREQYPDFTFFPGMPYAHKYANAITTDGMMGAMRRFLPNEGSRGRRHAAAPRRWSARTSKGWSRC